MSRLIDADSLQNNGYKMIFAWRCTERDLAFLNAMVINEPTVEAIPISWLRAKADSWNAELKTACPEDAETIRHIQQKYLGIIEEWRKEHETY